MVLRYVGPDYTFEQQRVEINNLATDVVGLAVTPSYSTTAGYATTAGVSTYSTSAGISTYATTAGVSTTAITAGYATTAGIATIAQGLTGSPNITVGVITATLSRIGTSSTFTEDLVVNGDARITGILTIGTGSLTLDGKNNQVIVGTGVTLTETGNANYSGIVTANSFSGSGVRLTGIVTSIDAGSGISISQSTGNVTITATGGGGGGSQWVTTSVGINTLSNVGIGTTNPSDALTVLGKVQIQQDSSSTSRLVFRAKPGNAYRWNIDNDSTNNFRIFREDDATAANGVVYLGISTTGTVSATRFSGDGSLLTGIIASGSGVVIQNQGSNVGTASTINFSTNLTASFSSGTATISLSNNPSISGVLTANQVYTSNNGNGQNVRIGDDFWLGDVNAADTTRFSGAQDSTRAFVIFGSSDAVALGRTGTGPLYYGGNFNAAGVVTATSFSGSGTNLTGIVTSIVAGTNVTISGSTGQVTINASGGEAASIDLLEVMLFS